MKIKVLGGQGGIAKGFAATSLLIDDCLLIDAGAVASELSIDEQKNIKHILISHCHLDHIKDLAFLSDNCFGLREKPFEVYTHETVKKIIKEHLLNDIIWPDFTKLPSFDNPTMRIHGIAEEVEFFLDDYKITPVKVNHAHDAMGYIIEKGNVTVVFTMDTGPTFKIWEVAKKKSNLKAIFTEVSFPNSLKSVADVSCHHTPESMKEEIQKMPDSVPVILSHLKPTYQEEILKELLHLGNKRIQVLKKDGEIFSFT